MEDLSNFVSYALCDFKCRKSNKCARYLNRKSKVKPVLNFKAICGSKNDYQWFYTANTNIEKRTK